MNIFCFMHSYSQRRGHEGDRRTRHGQKPLLRPSRSGGREDVHGLALILLHLQAWKRRQKLTDEISFVGFSHSTLYSRNPLADSAVCHKFKYDLVLFGN